MKVLISIVIGLLTAVGCGHSLDDIERDAKAGLGGQTVGDTVERFPENHAIWQENGGEYNRLVMTIVVDGIGAPPGISLETNEWIKKASLYWEQEGRQKMEQHLKDGHPSAILWDKTGRNFKVGNH